MSTTSTFRAQPLARPAQGFRPMFGVPNATSSFVQQLPHDMVRSGPVEILEPQPDVASAAAGLEQVPSPQVAPKYVTISEQARADAIAEGRALGRQEAAANLSARQAELDAAAAAVNALLNNITLQMEAETDALANILVNMVRVLASERAGIQITTDPASFAERLVALAARITEGFATLSITMNPLDLNALQTVRDVGMPQLDRLFQADLKHDPLLARGDIRLRTQGLALDDLIHDRAGA